MSDFEILAGLPPYGPTALPFPEDGRASFSEGLVVLFRPANADAWTGNFQRGLTVFDTVLEHLDGRQLIVISGGEGYVVDPEIRRCTHSFGGTIDFAQTVAELNIVVICDRFAIGAFRADGTIGSTERISWDGIRNIAITGTVLKGEAWSPLSGSWTPFEVDLCTGSVRGGVYAREMAGALKITPSTDKRGDI